jgi:putative transposase
MMQLVEQYIISRADPRYAPIDAAAFAAKNLYNLANYLVRQAFIWERRYLDNTAIYHQVKQTEAYRALPCKVSNDILRQLDKNWRAFFAALQAWKEDPSKFVGRPKPPRYKDKTNGRFLLTYDLQAISRRALKQGIFKPSGLDIEVQTAQKAIKQARIVPGAGFYTIELVYEQPERPLQGDPKLIAAVDLGVDTLAALTSNKQGFCPRLINGRVLKSYNQFYNKRKAELQEALGHEGTTERMKRLTTKRARRINHYLHAASKAIIALLVVGGIGTLVIGKNLLWKQEADMGKRSNQNFVQIPHARFIEMLTYKAKLAGIAVVIQEESYTSKASFLDLDELPVYDLASPQQYEFSGKRVMRALYRAKDGRPIHADVNGSYNTLRKAFPDAFSNGTEAPAVGPVRFDIGAVSSARGAGRHATRTN